MKKKFFISFLISGILFVFLFAKVEKIFSALDTGDHGGINVDGEEIVTVDKNEIVVLLVGVDANDVHNSKGTRTDTMMLGKANFETGEIGLLSIPRDTRVMVRGKEDKINHAHAYGGMEMTMRTVRDFLNVDVNYYVKVDYKAVKAIVDAIGGVKLDVPRRMRYSDPTAKPPLKIDLQPGVQTLDGQKAHDFLRFRSYKDGDLGRVQAQQYFMKELMKQTMQPKNLLQLDDLIKTYYDYVDTNIPMSLMLKGGLSANKMDVDNMQTVTIPGKPQTIGGLSYWIYDPFETQKIVNDMFEKYIIGQ